MSTLAPRLPARHDWPVVLLSFSHGTTHWIMAAFYVMVPMIRDDLGLSYAQAGLFVTVLSFFSLTSNVYSGFLVDATGRRVMLQVVALVLGGLAFGMLGLAWEVIGLYALLAVVGATNNMWHPAAIAYLSTRYPHRRGYMLAIHALGANVGDALAPLAAGALLIWLSWRETAGVMALLPLIAAAMLMLTLLRADNAGRFESRTAMGFGDYLRGIRDILRNRAVLLLCVVSGCRSIAQTGLLLFLPLYLANVMGASPVMAGAALTALQVGGIVASPFAGMWSDRVGRRPVVMAGLMATTVLLAVLTLVGNASLFVAGVALTGFALFAVRPVMQSWMLDLTPPELAGSATSALFGIQALLRLATPLIGGVLADLYGIEAPFYFLAVVMLAGNALTILLPKSDPPRAPA